MLNVNPWQIVLVKFFINCIVDAYLFSEDITNFLLFTLFLVQNW